MTILRILTSLVAALFVCTTLISEVDARDYEYDDAGRIVKVTYDNGRTISYEYDEAGNASGGAVHGVDVGTGEMPKPLGEEGSASDDGGCAAAGHARTPDSDWLFFVVALFVLARLR